MGLTSEVLSTTRGEKISFRDNRNSHNDRSHPGISVPMKPMEVTITRQVEDSPSIDLDIEDGYKFGQDFHDPGRGEV